MKKNKNKELNYLLATIVGITLSAFACGTYILVKSYNKYKKFIKEKK